MGSIRDVERNKLLLLRVSEEVVEILKKLRKERHMTISELIREALDFIAGDPHVVEPVNWQQLPQVFHGKL